MVSTASRTNTDKVKIGDRFSETQYYEVMEIGKNPKGEKAFRVKNERGVEFFIDAGIVAEGMYSASIFEKTEAVTKTKAAEIVTNAGDTIFKANFTKADGSERTIICYLLNTENLMGRVNVRDLEVVQGNSTRQIDLRELHWVIFKGTKYTVK